MRRSTLAFALIASLPAAASAGGPVAVPLDEVRVVAFARPVSTLYVGNPVIADVTIIDNRHAFVQGKAFGATNIVALDARGHPVANQHIVVSGNGTATVTLLRGTQQTTYACAGARCQPAPQPGDGKDAFESTLDQISKHQSMLSKAATGEGQ